MVVDMKMTSKDRVLTTFAHHVPDRVPINYSYNPGIDRRLKDHFGLAPSDDEGLREALHVDFRGVGAPYVGPPLHDPAPSGSAFSINEVWGFRSRWIEHETGGYWEIADHPLRNATLEDVEAWPWPSPDDFDYEVAVADAWRYALYAVYAGNAATPDLLNGSTALFSMEEVLARLALDDEALLRHMDRRVALDTEVVSRTIEAAGGLIDFVWLGEDLGTQRGPLMSLELYRRHLRPRHQRVVDVAKAYGLPVMIHSCGSSSWAFEDFIEMGIHVIDTLQPEAEKMSPRFLKETYGDRLAFHGGVSTAGPLATGSPDDVRRDVTELLEIMMPGGGFCLAPTHQIQDNTPTENAVAMYETAFGRGRY